MAKENDVRRCRRLFRYFIFVLCLEQVTVKRDGWNESERERAKDIQTQRQRLRISRVVSLENWSVRVAAVNKIEFVLIKFD